MKLFAISDTHGALPQIPDCDVLVIAGDIMPLSLQRNISGSLWWFETSFADWVETLKCEKVIVIAGNHDFAFEPRWESFGVSKIGTNDKKLSDKIVYLEPGESYEYGGKTFYSFPWTPVLKNWAFYLDHDSLTKECDKIPKDLDVLISHCPPKVGQAGVVQQSGRNYKKDFGCEELADALKTRNVKYCICGHIHSGDKNEQVMDNDTKTKVYNVSVKDENYITYYDGTMLDI